MVSFFSLPSGLKNYFSGLNGCISCFAAGQYNRQAKVTLWPKERCRRTKSAHFFKVAWTKVAVEPGSSYYGVTGISPLAKLGNPADVNAFDPMHMVYRGNSMLIFTRFFESKPGKWSALFPPKEVKQLVDDLSRVQFPVEFNRTIPCIERLALFKASELKNLLLYAFIPAAAPFMSDLADHWHLAAAFVHAIRLLSQNVVTEDDVQIARRLIDIWQELIPELASDRVQNFNAHAVGHLPDQVLRFGPLWVTSAFCFESFNGDFVRLITSSKGPAQQVARRFVLQRYAMGQLLNLEKINPAIVLTINQLLGKNGQSINQLASPAVRLESYITFSATAVQAAIIAFFGVMPSTIRFAKKAIMTGGVYQALSYLKASTIRPRSLIVKYNNICETHMSVEYGCPIVFIDVDGHFYAACKKFDVRTRSIRTEVPAPVNALLLSAYNDDIYGSFFL